jgi:hypothetical protein
MHAARGDARNGVEGCEAAAGRDGKVGVLVAQRRQHRIPENM